MHDHRITCMPFCAALLSIQVELENTKLENFQLRQQLESTKSVLKKFAKSRTEHPVGHADGSRVEHNEKILLSTDVEEEELYNRPERLLSDAGAASMERFVRTYYHHAASVSSWLHKSQRMFHKLQVCSVPLLTAGHEDPSNTAATKIVNVNKLFEALDNVYLLTISTVDSFRGGVQTWRSR